MSRCIRCGRHGFFLSVDRHTKLCSKCQQEMSEIPCEAPAPSSLERSIEIPTIYIGNSTKSKLVKALEDVELKRPTLLPDFSKIDLCDNVDFSVQGDMIIAKRLNEMLGFIEDSYLVSEIATSLEKKYPIFSQILGYDDDTGEVHIVIAFYKIINYDYDQYTENRDASLEYETVGYY